MKTSVFRAATACALLASTCLVTPSMARAAQDTVSPDASLSPASSLALQQAGTSGASVYKNVDAQGVDLTDGSFNYELTEASVGAGNGALALVRYVGRGGLTDNLTLRFQRSESGVTAFISLTFGNNRIDFSGPAGGALFESAQGDGSRLERLGASSYRYSASDGTITNFGPPPGLTNAGNNGFCGPGSEFACELVAIDQTTPTGLITAFNWETGESCWQSGVDPSGDPVFECAQYWRMRGLSNNLGSSASFAFVQEQAPDIGLPPAAWQQRASATLATSVGGSSRTVQYSYPSLFALDIQTPDGQIWSIDRSAGAVRIKRPGEASAGIVATYGSDGIRVAQASIDGVTSQYSYSDSSTSRTTVATNALGQQRTVVSDITIGRPTSDSFAGRTTQFQYDANGRLQRVTAPEGNATEYAYDARGNVMSEVRFAKASALPAITRSASFPATCANLATCNQPTSTSDARGNVTDYSYYPHGGVHTITAPSPSPGTSRPQVVYSYGAVGGVQVLTSVSQCATGSPGACAGTADEVRTTIAYGANLLPTIISTGAGDGGPTATQNIAYDGIGNVVSVDGPLPGAADTVYYRYDLSRRLVGTISPDPDGGGPLPRRAERRLYDGSGLLIRAERGTVAGPSDAQWNAFNPIEAVALSYQSRRQVSRRLEAGGMSHALVQTSHDALGRVACVAQRLNPAAFGAPPADACVLGAQGAFGPDRIGRTHYNAAGEVERLESGVGTAAVGNEAVLNYTLNGRVATVTDGEGNRTSYDYDAHDRLYRTRYPVTAKGANQSSATDYEQIAYDATGNVTSRRVRSGETIGFTYDALGRLTFKNLPGAEPDVTYGYDNLGRLISASQPGMALGFGYDALGRNLTQSGPLGTVTSQYDLAGRRTRLIHPDGFTLDHGYLVTGEMASISQPGAIFSPPVTLATFGYDNLGRRTSLTRGNGTSTSYAYDPVSRLSLLSHDLAGTAHDLSLGFAYNPASQITSNTRSNDTYAWTGHGTGTTGYVHDGLNRMTSAGGFTIGHDTRGNVTGDPALGLGYGYSSENLLTTVNGGAWTGTLTYDPLMRLYDSGVGARTRVLHDGHSRIAEYNLGGTQVARFVFGSGSDEPLIEYEGANLATRRWLHADERGTIVGASDDAGNSVGIGRFDEYGRPQSFAGGRFGYAGMPYETVSELFYARARMYNPRLGRFMQTDPIGYGDGMNLYAYVGGDPVNMVDRTGRSRVALDNDPSIRPHVELGGGYTVWGSRGGSDFTGNFASVGFGGEPSGGTPQNNFVALPPVSDEQRIVVTGRRIVQRRQNILVIVEFGRWRGIPWAPDPIGRFEYVVPHTLTSRVRQCLREGPLEGYANFDIVDLLQDTGLGAARGAAQGAATGAVWGSVFGPAGASGGAAKGAIGGALRGAAGSAALNYINQICQ